MRALKAHVLNGKLVLDEPATDLAEGTEVQLVVVGEDLAGEERERLLQSLNEADDEFERGEHVDGFEFIANLRAKASTDAGERALAFD